MKQTQTMLFGCLENSDLEANKLKRHMAITFLEEDHQDADAFVCYLDWPFRRES